VYRSQIRQSAREGSRPGEVSPPEALRPCSRSTRPASAKRVSIRRLASRLWSEPAPPWLARLQPFQNRAGG
jgi:hypothetical protein